MAYKSSVTVEKFRPAGGQGLSVDIRWGSKFTPRMIQQWNPVARLAAVWAFHMRDRVRDRKRGPDGGTLGPGVVSGAMWKSLTVSIRASRGGKGAMAYFARSSPPYSRLETGEIVRRRHRKEKGEKKGKFVKSVPNKFKALAVSGMTRVFKILPDYSGQLAPRLVQQTKAAGGGRPMMILTPSASEGSAVMSFLAMGIERRGMEGNQQARPAPRRGDRRLLSSLRRSL